MFGIRDIGPLQILVVLFIIMLLFGVGKLPEVGAGLGKGFREFRSAIRSGEEQEEKKPAASKDAKDAS